MRFLYLALVSWTICWTGASHAAEDPPRRAIEVPNVAADEGMFENAVPTISLDQIQAGQKGWGLSVFRGNEPVRFDAEVIGVWTSSSLEMEYLLAKLSGQDLQRSGVLAGMSGSPVYIDDKLVGAVAFSFTFGLDPIAGITPISAMRKLSGATGGLLNDLDPPSIQPVGDVSGGERLAASPVALPTLHELASAEFLAADRDELQATLRRSFDLLRPAGADALSGQRSAMVWTASGFGGAAAEMLTSSAGMLATPSVRSGSLGFTATAAAGSRTLEEVTDLASADLQPGDAVSLVLMRGDLNMAAHGTVTDRWGDEIVAFGHPVYSLGPTRFPMAESEVVTTIANVASSFKLSNPGRLLGVFDQDREAGAHGVLGARPELVPYQIRLRGLVERDYSMELADAPMFRPTLLAVGLLGSLTSGSYASGFQGYDVTATFHLAERDDLVLRRSFDGSDAAMESVVFLLTYAYFLEFNELGRVDLEAVELDVVQSDRPRVADLVSAHTERGRVQPGDTVGIWLETQPFRGETERQRIEVEIPEEAEAGTYYVMIGDGASLDAVRLQVRQTEPETLDQALDVLRSFHSNRELHVVGLTAGGGLAVGGASLPELPGSVRGLFSRAGVGKAQRLRIRSETVLESDRPLSGVVRVDLEVTEPPV
ncbi:MAG: hypothetical protein MPN21_16325 [Thermoanaerobaculia bacterium]|nr:hypothetical protein [Thermoanaerobaculia bacterium]